MMRIDYQTYGKLLAAALCLIATERWREASPPGRHDDAEAELNDERLLIAAREFVAAHEGQEVVGG